MDENEFLGIAELASLAVPQDPKDREAFWKARTLLRAFARRVTRMSEATRTASGSPLAGSPLAGSPLAGSPLAGSPLAGSPLTGQAPCPLRPDDPKGGLPEGAAFEIAPETGARLIQVPRVL